MTVYDVPELTDAYRVDDSGNVHLPLCGPIQVVGLTRQQAAKLIEDALKGGQILTDPQVNIDIQQYAEHYATVLGEVATPGRVMLIASSKLSDVLAQVGGPTQLAGGQVEIRHASGGSSVVNTFPLSRTRSNPVTESLLIEPGDMINIPRAGIIYVLGAVTRPGGYVMQEDGKINVAEALALGGGTLPQAKTSGLRVIRRDPDGSILDISLSYNGIAQGSQVPLDLVAQDIVYVPMSKLRASFVSAAGILSAATSASIVATH